MSDQKTRAHALADRIEQGASTLASFAEGLSEAEWQKAVPGDGRPIGVVVHHVASVYPVEVQLAHILASGEPITDVTWDVVNKMNADHAGDNAGANQEETVALLRQNGGTAADAVRQFTDDQLDRAAPVSLNADAPLTAQFFIEDHALRHSFHHLKKMREAVSG